MGKKRGGQQRSSPGLGQPSNDRQPEHAQMNSAAQQPWNGHTGDAFVPDRVTQIRQGDYYDFCDWYNQNRIDIYTAVDSWRSYRDDTNNLQTATDFQSFHQSHPRFFGSAQQRTNPPPPQGLHASAWTHQPPQGQQAYLPALLENQAHSSAPQAMNAGALPFRPNSKIQHSHFTPYQPLRVSDGTREREFIKQAKNVLQTAQTQDPRRYKFRERRPDQIAPYSSRAVADLPFPSIETTGSSKFLGVPSIQKVPQRRGRTPEVKDPVAPTATKEYKRNAELAPALRTTPQKLLVILDLNGTLLVRPNKYRPKNILVRPGVNQLLDYLFQNHVVMVYSSAKPENCTAMIEKFFHPTQRSALAGVWARDKLGLTRVQYDNKVQVYKQLKPIWKDNDIQKKAEPGRKWDQSNTVLVDDSQLKALAQPHNLLQIPEFLNNAPKQSIQAQLDWHLGEEAIVHSVQQKLEELKFQVDVSRLIREWQTGKQRAPGVVDETVDQKALQNTQDRATSLTPTPSIEDWDSSAPQQLQTPEASPMSIFHAERPEYKPVEDDVGVSPGDGEGSNSTLDELEKEINRNLSLNMPDRKPNQTAGAATAAGVAAIGEAQRQSESPANESVRTDLLRGNGGRAHVTQSNKKTAYEDHKSRSKGKKKGEKKSKSEGEIGGRGTGKVKGEDSGDLEGAPRTPESMGA